MATLGSTVLTLADWAKRRDPNGKTADIVEMLQQTNEILLDALWKEGNLATGNRTTLRTSLPTVTARNFNQGVATSKSTTAQIEDACAMLEARSQVDEDEANLEGDLNAFRLSEAQPFTEAMNQKMAQLLFYGNSGTTPNEFTGLAPRYNSLSGNVSQNVLSGGGSGSDNSSIWLVVWGAQTLHGIFPKGSMAGLEHKDLGLADAFDSDNNRFRAYMDLWKWKCGLAVKDWRYAVRICHLDISALVAKSSAADLRELMIKATKRIPSMGMGRASFYMNRTCEEMLDIQGRDDVQSGGQLKYEDVDGRKALTFRGIPIRICDQLTESEAAVA